MDSNLLKEAIADAKAVRQTALANAKAALEEAFGNRLEAMFAPKLEEDSMDSAAPSAPAAPVAAPAMEQEAVVNETDIEEIIRELEAELPQQGQDPTLGATAPAPEMGAGAPPVGVPPVPAPSPEMGLGAGAGAPPVGAPPVPAPAPEMGLGAGAPPAAPDAVGAPPVPAPAPQKDEDEMDEEIDINELLESLKEETEEDEDKDKDNKPPWLKENAPVHTSGIGGGKAGGTDNKEPSADASKSSHIESSGQSVKSATVGTPEYNQTSQGDDPSQAKRPNAGPVTKAKMSTPSLTNEAANVKSGKVGWPEGAKKTSTSDDPSEVSDMPNAGPVTPEKMDTPALHKENVALKGQLKEAEDTLTYLRTQLNEINLLNAKLLYTNKLFKEYSMNNDKKMKIVEMFDLAKNVREVKMTYAVIAESLNFGADFKKKVSSKVQSITEGMASKPVAGTAPSKQIIAEGAKSDMVSKFQRLAGIKTPSTTKQ